MKIVVRKTDKDGYFIGDVSIEKNKNILPSKHYDVRPPIGLVKAKINDSKTGWIEGATASELEADEAKKLEEHISTKKEAIGAFVYGFYSMQKQSEDRSYQSYDQTAVVGISHELNMLDDSMPVITTDGLKLEIMQQVLSYFTQLQTEDSVTAEEYIATFIANKHERQQEHYGRLLEIGIKLKWCKMCIDEGKQALVESRKPKYPPYPLGGA